MKLVCTRSLTEIERIVAATELFFAENNVGRSIRFVVDLVIEELFVNMVNYNTETDAQIEIEFFPDPNGIKVSLTDFNVERFDPTAHGDVDTSAGASERTPGGLGVFLVLKMVDSIQYDYKNRTSKITFIKYVESE